MRLWEERGRLEGCRGLPRDEDQASAPVGSGAGIGEKGALGRPVSPSPRATPVKGLGAGPHRAEASPPAAWPWIPCPARERSGLPPCFLAAATGQSRGNPSSPSEVPGSSSALSGQTGNQTRERMRRSAPSETHPAFPQTDPALGAGSGTRSKLLDLSEP